MSKSTSLASVGGGFSRTLNDKRIRLGIMLFALIVGLNIQIRMISAEDVTYPGTSTWVIDADKDYRITTDFELQGDIDVYGNLTIENCTITIKDSSYVVSTYNSGNLTLKNVLIVGTKTSQGTKNGAMRILHKGARLSVSSCTFNSMGDFAIVTYKEFTVRNSVFNSIKGDAIRIIEDGASSFNEIAIENNSFSDLGDFFAITAPDYFFSANLVNWSIGWNNISNSGGILLKNIDSLNITGNNFNDISSRALMLDSCTDIHIINNTFTQTGETVKIYSCQNSVIDGNVLNSVSQYGFLIQEQYGKFDLFNNYIKIVSEEGRGLIIEGSNNMHNITVDSLSIENSVNNVQAKIKPIDILPNLYGKVNLHFMNGSKIDGKSVISIDGLKNNTINFETFTNVSQFLILNSKNITCANLNIDNEYGVIIYNVTDSEFDNFTVNENVYTGIEAIFSSNNSFINITSSNNGYDGFYSHSTTQYAEFPEFNSYLNCTFNNNSRSGLRLTLERNATILGVRAFNNFNGFLLTGIQSVRIGNCSFKNNSFRGVGLIEAQLGANNNVSITNCTFSNNHAINLDLETDNSQFMSYIKYCEFIKYASDGAVNIQYNPYTTPIMAVFDYNHYSDHIGFDMNPKDGISDTPYRVNPDRNDILDMHPIYIDTDGDGLDDLMEYSYGTDPDDPDDDDDGLNDFEELFPEYVFNAGNYTFVLSSTDPFNNDTDSDGLSDYDELIMYYTNPNDDDTDNDGFSDIDEILRGSDPLDEDDWPGKSENPAQFKDPDESGVLGEEEPERSILSVPGYPIEIFLAVIITAGVIKTEKIRKRVVRRKC